MRTDPRKACANPEEIFFWAWVHDAIAHPLMALTNWAKWTVRFHNYTSEKAWPRKFKSSFRVYRFWHPRVAHEFVTGGMSEQEALIKAHAWFKELAEEFGGRFALKFGEQIRWEVQ